MSTYTIIKDDHLNIVIFADYVVFDEGLVRFMKETPFGTPNEVVAAFNENSIVGWFKGE